MFKYNYGRITNPKTGESTDVIVNGMKPNTVKDVLIGGGLVAMGIYYLTTAAFRHGSDEHYEADTKALLECCLVKETEI